MSINVCNGRNSNFNKEIEQNLSVGIVLQEQKEGRALRLRRHYRQHPQQFKASQVEILSPAHIALRQSLETSGDYLP
jgi:hypothetical protein